jgi:hypothetical protein
LLFIPPNVNSPVEKLPYILEPASATAVELEAGAWAAPKTEEAPPITAVGSKFIVYLVAGLLIKKSAKAPTATTTPIFTKLLEDKREEEALGTTTTVGFDFMLSLAICFAALYCPTTDLKILTPLLNNPARPLTASPIPLKKLFEPELLGSADTFKEPTSGRLPIPQDPVFISLGCTLILIPFYLCKKLAAVLKI